MSVWCKQSNAVRMWMRRQNRWAHTNTHTHTKRNIHMHTYITYAANLPNYKQKWTHSAGEWVGREWAVGRHTYIHTQLNSWVLQCKRNARLVLLWNIYANAKCEQFWRIHAREGSFQNPHGEEREAGGTFSLAKVESKSVCSSVAVRWISYKEMQRCTWEQIFKYATKDWLQQIFRTCYKELVATLFHAHALKMHWANAKNYKAHSA